MNDSTTIVTDARSSTPPTGRKIRWALFVGLLIYLLATALNSLLALILGVGGADWGGKFDVGGRISLVILGLNLPLTLAALVLFGMGMRKPPIRSRAVWWCFGLGVACVVYSVLADLFLGIDLY